jgi:thioredoxin 1
MKYLYFSAPWCGPCKMFGPVMERVGTKVNVQKINVDENQDLAMRYSVRSIPTVVLVGDDGKEYARQTGMQNENMLLEQYNNFANG